MEIQMKDIVKGFGSNKVLLGVNLDIKSGEVHALMGENGAGKSTLMNILTGLHKYDSGTIIINGEKRTFENPKEAEENGISFIHQEMITWPDMTVLENLFMGREMKTGWGWIKTKDMRRIAEKLFEDLGVNIDLNREMRTLSVGQQQLVEIAKSLMSNAEVIIMDEPTAALTEREINVLFDTIEKLTAKNVAIIYISHRMEEIFAISDRITVMRDGVSVDTKPTAQTDNDEVVRKMVGRDLEDYYPDIETENGDVLFEVKDLSDGRHYQNINFSVRQGEILGVSGLMGAGRTEIMRGIFGMDKLASGKLLLDGEEISIKSPADAIQKGIGFLTENRKEEGLILGDSLRENISLPSINEFSRTGWINTKEEKEFAELLIKRLTVKTVSGEVPVNTLSGGNQQKVVLAKWIGAGSRVLILDEPTRGVDVGAKREIYMLMKELAERGVGIIMVSSDLPEIIGISDRVIVVHEGHIAGEVEKEELSEEKIMTLATGGYK
ncbi:ribose ABC transporter ATP-binding protein [Alkalibacterium putridalgicola]|uniref:Ribose ABC transporter ATP-binding protein n=1 Tax=Alkalibacterium putridalgicola TaxID=426703 RepID=A0A1H7S1W9_9LACT|nr:sugar ABC transporter ATP-binding protein [Alkalibacterium putridalgicola]GEK88341.1 ribose import ATP-binding protein RbsA [Alkalibacterium putridalgicola]SEL65587.1 ribose ABC transporter ATP-binding protein [Alkalibacterium putridalgicola]